ncbi:Heterokaryon incompatibility protein (HET) domain containing protein [Rhypophila decipiens]
MAPYVYSQLGPGEIRLLVLAPRSGWDEVICRLEHRLLSSDLDYEALSYCWGVDDKDHQVICDGKIIKITASLYSALRHLSFKRKERRLWVDGICINQDDDHEKNHRVSMMEVETAVGRVERLRMPIIKPSSANSSTNLIRQIAPILHCPWFQRLWVVQELALARESEFVAGFKQVTTWKMMQLLQTIWAQLWKPALLKFHSAINFMQLCIIRKRVQTGQLSPIFFLELLQLTEYFLVTDERDRLHALFGLSPVSKGFPVKDEDGVSDVFVNFAVWALSEFTDLALLSFSRGPDNTLPPPSWAPSYGMCGLPSSFLDKTQRFSIWGTGLPDTIKNSSGSHGRNSPSTTSSSDDVDGDTPTSLFEVHGHTLLLNGVFLDMVQDTFPVELHTALGKELRGNLGTLRQWAYRIARGKESRAAMIRRLAAALILSSGNDEHSLLTAVVEYIQQPDTLHLFQRRLGQNISITARCRCLGLTAGGRLAWLPRRNLPQLTDLSCNTRVGDRICAFRGARLPYVVRPVGDGTYKLVGECCVEGIMQGEWLLRKEAKQDSDNTTQSFLSAPNNQVASMGQLPDSYFDPIPRPTKEEFEYVANYDAKIQKTQWPEQYQKYFLDDNIILFMRRTLPEPNAVDDVKPSTPSHYPQHRHFANPVLSTKYLLGTDRRENLPRLNTIRTKSFPQSL